MLRAFVGFVFAALSIITLSDASATFIDGNNLIPMMREYEKATRSDPNTNYTLAGQFQGFVLGAGDALSGVIICPPGNVTGGQAATIVMKYLNDHPDKWHMSGVKLVASALRANFPCPTSQ